MALEHLIGRTVRTVEIDAAAGIATIRCEDGTVVEAAAPRRLPPSMYKAAYEAYRHGEMPRPRSTDYGLTSRQARMIRGRLRRSR